MRRVVLFTDRGVGWWLWQRMYVAIARAFAAFVCRGQRRPAVYVRGTGASDEVLHGLSDIDLVIVTGPDPNRVGHKTILERCTKARRVIPGDLVWPLVYDETSLAALAARSVMTYEFNPASRSYEYSHSALLERPELYGMRSWRRLSGPDRRPVEPPSDEASRRIDSWLELQNWWRWAFHACLEPNQAGAAYTCVKLVAEAVRIWMWLTRGEQLVDRSQALARGRVELAAEADVFERALRLFAVVRAMPAASLADFLPAFVRISGRIGGELARQIAPFGATEVSLIASARDELATYECSPPPGEPVRDSDPGRLLPLCDWRAIVAPPQPEETFALLSGDPGDPRLLARVARASGRGCYLTLTTDGLMIRPTPRDRSALRAVQCQPTDPVSHALAQDKLVARFPNVPGWSIVDTARRAVSEHAARLAADTCEPSAVTMRRLLTAARAGLLAWSIAEQEPQLTLTMDTTLELLASWVPSAAPVADAALEAFHELAGAGASPSRRVLAALRRTVFGLPAYADVLRR